MESHATNEQLHQQMNRWKAMAANNIPKMSMDYIANCAVVINDSSANNAESIMTSAPTNTLIQEAKADIKRMKQCITESKFVANIFHTSILQADC